jgi:hypothetical protein
MFIHTKECYTKLMLGEVCCKYQNGQKKKKEASIRLKKKVTKGLIENINYAKI